ncbi:tetratricopeptide repeat protein [Pseudomonas viridiflava]|uniref:tetratricopeptide repeat protein n=1 Tax=Pseudomonas viridiflava TaxID=33069 RepID=UPI000402A624|nr:tetratricopeptide repeat protein [Pseudomonas viridiflava]
MSWNLARKEWLNIDDLRAMLEESPAQAAKAILAAATHGNVEAHALLGQILLDGSGIQRDQALAMTWFGIAANQGHSMARNMLGRCFEHGWGCTPDLLQAALHYRLAAEQGLDWGLYNLGNLLATGRGVEQDHRQAMDCYRKAATLGHAKSMNLLGRYLEEGVTGHRDLSAAHECYRRSAEGGDFRGQFSHATVLAESGDIEQARGWLKKALAGGNLNFLRVGRKVLLDATHPDIQRMATDYFQRAAAIGDESDRMALRDFSARPA